MSLVKSRIARAVASLLLASSFAVTANLAFSAATAEALPPGYSPNGCTTGPVQPGYNETFRCQCNRHDYCYDELWYGWGWYNPTNGGWTGRLACDNLFHSEMRAKCGTDYSWSWPRRYACYTAAAAYYQAVRTFGAPFFANPYLN